MIALLRRILDKDVQDEVVQKDFAGEEAKRFKEALSKIKVKCRTYEDDDTRTIAIRPDKDEFPRFRKVLTDAGLSPNEWLDKQVTLTEKAGESAEEGWFRFVTRKYE